MPNIFDIKFETTTTHSKNIIFIDGITRSGKFWLANFFHHIEMMEHLRHVPIMDHVSVANFLGLIDDNAAISIMQNMINMYAYENIIGRNINFRFSDSSSIFKNPDLQNYLLRTFGHDQDPQIIFDELRENKSNFVFLTHDLLSNFRIQLEAFPELKLIRVERNPIDLVNAWHTKGLGHDRMAFGLRIQGMKGSIPWFASTWVEDFETFNEIDRIIFSILTLDNMAKKTYRSITELQKHILFISYESMAYSPLDTINTIANFLGCAKKSSAHSFAAGNIFQDRSKSKLLAGREQKRLFIQKMASPDLFLKLEEAATEYDKIFSN